MKKIINIQYIFLLLFILILLAFLRYLYIAGTNLASHEKTSWDIILECQRISATSTNEHWTYQNCKRELYLQLPQRGLLI